MTPAKPSGIAVGWRIAKIIVACLATICAAPIGHAKTHLKISVNASAMDGFTNWTSGTPWQSIDNFKNGNATRPVVDLVLELQALKAGGLDFDFEFVSTLTNATAKQAVIDGSCDVTAETIWETEIDQNSDRLLKTQPVIAQGEFEKGIYVLPTNERLLKVTDLAGLKDATAAVVSTWAVDSATVAAMPLKGVHKVATPELAYTAIQQGKADFMLDEFSSQPGMRVDRAMIRLVPIPGLKVGLHGSRSWIVSKHSANADTVFKALSAGLNTLRQNGTLKRAYTQSGFFNANVADWKPVF